MKIIKVENCRICHNLIEVGYPDYYPACAEKFRMQGIIFKISDINEIPKWCPLEDYKEVDHETLT